MYVWKTLGYVLVYVWHEVLGGVCYNVYMIEMLKYKNEPKSRQA